MSEISPGWRAHVQAWTEEIANLKRELADTKADYLRRHNDAADRWLECEALKRELAEAKAQNAALRAELQAMVDRFSGYQGMELVTAKELLAGVAETEGHSQRTD